jgi:hypothetical protein
MIDWRGITVAVGDTVLYSTRSSSWMGMVEGVVESIDGDDAKVRITRRQGSGAKDLVTVSNRHLTVVSLPTSAEPTLAEEIAAAEVRRAKAQAEREALEAACGDNHEWSNQHGWRTCRKCRKYEYGDWWPEGFRPRRW